MPALPYWLSSAPLQVGPIGGAFQTVSSAASAVLQGLKTTLVGNADKAAAVNGRLVSWYQTQQKINPAALDTLDTSVQDFLDGSWNTGLHWYVMKPDFGGFSRIRSTVARDLRRPQSDPNIPNFPDTAHVGGFFLLFAGPPEEIFEAAKIVLLIFFGKTDLANQAIRELFEDSAAMGAISSAAGDLVDLPQDLWSDTAQALEQAISDSPIGKLLDGDAFPLNMVNSSRLVISYAEPLSVKKAPLGVAPANLEKLHVVGENFEPADYVKINGIRCATIVENPSRLVATIPAAVYGAVGTYAVQVNHRSTDVSAGTLEVEPDSSFGQLNALFDQASWDRWHEISVGDSLNKLMPGVGVVVENVANLLTKLGAGFNELSNYVQGAPQGVSEAGLRFLKRTGQIITRGSARVGNDIDQVDNGVQQFIAELQQVYASVLVIPPSLGGNHQLNFALSQGFSNLVSNRPQITDDDCVFGIFVCAGSPDRNVVLQSLNTAANVLQVSSWVPLG